MPTRVLETVLTGRDLLSPVLAKAGAGVAAFNTQVAGANTRGAAAASSGAGAQSTASTQVVRANARNAESATVSANTQSRAHARAAESATASARIQQSATNALTRSNGLLGASLTPVTAGLGAVGLGLGYAAYRGMEFDTAMSRVQAATQASAGTMGNLREAVITLGADTKFSSVEAAGGVTELAKAGVSASNILGGGLKGALNLAAAGEMEVADAAEIGATALNVFNLKGDQMTHVADLLAAGAGKAQGSVYDLGQALNQSALVASATGLSIEETAGSLALFASQGLVGSDAGTSFRQMLLHLQAPSKESAAVMADLGLSMYDANGQFIGMQALAEQLRTGMAGLTQEQRDQAMATIFGADAVRASNILFEAGAKGVAEWTAKVDDAGYAAKQAAQLQDNLRGDLEKLGGAFDSAATTAGGVLQPALRVIVQGLTDVVGIGGDVLGFLSDNSELAITLAAILAVQLAGGIGAVTVAFNRLILTRAVLGLSSVLGTVLNLPAAFAAASGAVGGFLTAAAPLAAVAAVVYAIAKTVEFAHAAGDAREEIAGMWEAVADARGAEQLSAASGLVGQLEDKVHALKAEMAEDSWASVGNPFAMADLATAGQKLDEYEAGLKRAREAQELVEDSAARLGGQFHMTGDEVLSLAGKYGIDLTGSVSETKRLFENFYSMEFGAKPTEATVAVAAAMEDAKTSIDDAKQAVDGFKLSLDILTGAHVSMIEVESAFEAAVASADGAVKDLGGSVLDASGALNMKSESGRKAADVLLDVRDSGNQLIATMIQEGATADEVRAKDAQLRDSFYRSALQMGIGSDAAHKLTDAIFGVPEERETKISADTQAARDAIAATQRDIDNMHGRTLLINVRAHQSLEQQLGRTYFGQIPEYDTGGYTGHGRKKDVAGLVHAGEVVFSQDDVAAHGGPARVDAMRKSRGGLPGYADGGPVLPIEVALDDRGLASGITGALDGMARAVANVPLAFTSGTATASASQLVSFGHVLQRMGAIVSEHPAFGGVTMGAHVPGSKHYSGRAIDVNTRPGTSALEQRELAPMAAMAAAAGFGTIFMAPGHFNHLHVNSYQTGTGFVPSDGLAYLHRGERVVPEAQNRAPAAMPGYGQAPAPQVNIVFVVDGQEFRGMARTVVNDRLEDLYRKKTFR